MEIKSIGEIEFHPDQKERFKSGGLWKEWAEQYPFLFDHDDIRIMNNQATMGIHFFEWLGAILIYHSTGYLSLVEQYEFKHHERKYKILKKLASSDLIEIITNHKEFGRTQCPDLLVYAPDFSDWYFCEVKGPTDRLRSEQRKFFEYLYNKSGKPIRSLHFKDI